MVISFDFQRMTYAQDLTFGLRLAFGLGLEVLVALASALLGYLAFLIASLPCLSALPCCLALACRRYFARLSAFAALLAVVPCPALRFPLLCLLMVLMVVPMAMSFHCPCTKQPIKIIACILDFDMHLSACAVYFDRVP